MAAVASPTPSWRPRSPGWHARCDAAGVEPGDRVAYLMPNLPEMLIAHFAVPLAGGVLVAMNTRLVAEEMSSHPAPFGREAPGHRRGDAGHGGGGREGPGRDLRLVVAEDAEASSAKFCRAPIWALTPGW